ncbi:MAG: hypothetical protein RLZZ77_327 [Bacteroidota bacterium]|jgi:KUP system potassium uptake protein
MSSEHLSTTSKVTTASLLVALGIIYGDIGTSPLYVFKSIIGPRPITEELVLGGVSCVIWTLILQTTIKYVWLTLKADNDGEGGIFSLYALVRRYSKWLVIPTILGATTLLADGIITPPISVASAVEGITLIPSLAYLPTVPIVVVILSALFFFQRYGTHKVGRVFGPVMFIWFGLLLVLGLSQALTFPSVFRAFNPHYAIELLTLYPQGFWLLGAVFLATTGAEALYSDLGHCGRKNIRITWFFVKTCLIANYLGQAAWALQFGGTTLGDRNPFYEMMPEWFLIPGILIATAATIIASQALISGSYTLISEAIHLNFWPRVAIHQPSDLKGQIYVPSVNTILWIGCVLMIVYFQSSSHMEAAYGFSITVAMMMTTYLLAFFMIYKLKWNKFLVFGLILLFATVELSFFIANVAKIKERWMFLFFELFIFLTMYIWYYGRKINNRFTHFVDVGKYAPIIQRLKQDESITRSANHLIYLTKANNRHEVEEKIIQSILSQHPKRADVYWLLHIHRTEQPFTLAYEVSELVDDTIIKVNVHVGFRIQPHTEQYFKQIIHDLIANQELNMHEHWKSHSVYSHEPHFQFVIIEKYLSTENQLNMKQYLFMKFYFFLKKLGLQDTKAFGIDKSHALIEYKPLIITPPTATTLKRISYEK